MKTKIVFNRFWKKILSKKKRFWKKI